jgi:hypothetical protein
MPCQRPACRAARVWLTSVGAAVGPAVGSNVGDAVGYCETTSSSV